jgi:hypothetical protein
LITRLTPGVLLPLDHRHELKFLIPITFLDMTTITVIDHGMSLSVLYKCISAESKQCLEKLCQICSRIQDLTPNSFLCAFGTDMVSPPISKVPPSVKLIEIPAFYFLPPQFE